MIVTLCYIVLVFITICVCASCFRIAKTSSSLILVVPIAVMYFWSIYGAWSWIPMKLSGGVDFYETIAYTVNIDEYYLESLIFYSIFIMVFCAYVKRVAKRYSTTFDELNRRREVYKDYFDILNHSKLYYLIMYSLLVAFVYFSMRDLSTAMRQGVSAYGLSRFNSSLGGLSSMIAFFGDTFLYLSVPLLFCRKNMAQKMSVIAPIGVYFFINLLLGNRNTLLCGLVIGVVIFAELYGLKQTFRPKYLAIGIISLTAIQMISFVRGMSINQILSGNYDFNFFDVLDSTTGSAEKYAAQISMYGVLANNVSPTWGTSVLFLISTLIPSFLGIPRPDRIYTYYVFQTMHGKPDIGITLHHATAWYLNFGFIGIILGALLWGWVFKYLYSRRNRFVYFYGAVLFSAVSIQMIRDSGIESYKGCLLLATILPMLIAHFCIKQKVNTVR